MISCGPGKLCGVHPKRTPETRDKGTTFSTPCWHFSGTHNPGATPSLCATVRGGAFPLDRTSVPTARARPKRSSPSPSAPHAGDWVIGEALQRWGEAKTEGAQHDNARSRAHRARPPRPHAAARGAAMDPRVGPVALGEERAKVSQPTPRPRSAPTGASQESIDRRSGRCLVAVKCPKKDRRVASSFGGGRGETEKDLFVCGCLRARRHSGSVVDVLTDTPRFTPRPLCARDAANGFLVAEICSRYFPVSGPSRSARLPKTTRVHHTKIQTPHTDAPFVPASAFHPRAPLAGGHPDALLFQRLLDGV